MREKKGRIGKYELLEFLGGGMSFVYRAQDTVLGRIVAIKILNSKTSDPETGARFLHEARVSANLSHENIIRIYDYGQDGDDFYMVMEFLEGETLRDALRNGSAVSLLAKLKILLQVGRAIQYAHSQGVVHRDIKPENVHIDQARRVRLLDFGIAKSAGLTLTKSGFTLGTPYYLAPEQLTGKEVTHRIDVYAFGILLYEVIGGERPFRGDSVEAVFGQILHAPIDLAPIEAAGGPEDLVHLVRACTIRNPGDRIAGFDQIVDRLSHAISILELAPLPEVAPTARPEPRPEPPAPPGSIPAGPIPPAAPSWKQAALRTLPLLAGACIVAYSALSQSALALAAGGALLLLGFLRLRASMGHGSPESTAAPQDFGAPAPMSFAAAAHSTRLVQTMPDAASLSAATGPEEFTGMFPLAGVPGSTPKESHPGVSIAISLCSDQRFIGRKIAVANFPFRIGRSETAGLNLEFDSGISRVHAEINFGDLGFTITDLGSANGTFVNGRRLPAAVPEVLLFGARIDIGGNTHLVFVADDLEEIPDLSGRKIGGRFLLERKLHSTAKSAVYAANDDNFNHTVAVKILAPRLARYPGYRRQFESDARTASRLRHANICRVLAYGETDLGPGAQERTLYVCVEWLEGGSLASRIAGGEMFELDRVVGWLEKLCGVLDYLRDAGVVHGAIKPSAIVFDGSGDPLLTDFAVALTVGENSARSVIGSPAFLAPEQWEGSGGVPATDQYALAAVIYCALAGVAPFEGQENPQVRKRNLARGPAPVHEMAAENGRPAVPEALAPALRRALSEDPAARFPSAFDFARAARQALSAAPARSTPYVFLSYHRASSAPWALLLRNELQRRYGYEVFLDVGQRDTAGRFPRKLEQAISRCTVFVCLLAEETLDSEWVRREIELAFRAGKFMIPVFQETFQHPQNLEECEAHLRDLLSFDGVKLLDRQNIYVDATIQSLAETIRQSAAGDTPASSG
ncbi:MAG: protein kinase [Bryobacteraceae bacterium]|nr:protein kinase [Bryobacteraceae bacterium]